MIAEKIAARGTSRNKEDRGQLMTMSKSADLLNVSVPSITRARRVRTKGVPELLVRPDRVLRRWMLASRSIGCRMPVYLEAWLSGIVGTAQRKGKIGLVVWRPMNARDEKAIVMMRLRDFEELRSRIGEDQD